MKALVFVDASVPAHAAFEECLRWIKPATDELFVVHCVDYMRGNAPPGLQSFLPFGLPAAEEANQTLKNNGKQIVAAYESLCKERGVWFRFFSGGQSAPHSSHRPQRHDPLQHPHTHTPSTTRTLTSKSTPHPQVQKVHLSVIASFTSKEDACQYAESKDVDMAFVGSRGLGALEYIVLGSFSSYILNHLPCSTMVVKKPVEAEGA